MNAPMQNIMPSTIMIDCMCLEELISMRGPIKIRLEGDTTLGKFIRNIQEPLIFNCRSHIILAFLLTFSLVHIPSAYEPVTPSALSFIMDPCNHKPFHLNDGTSRVGLSHATIDATDYYETYFPEDDKVAMSALEDEVRVVCEFKEDSKVDLQVGREIPDLGCTRTRNSKFFHTLELY